MKLFHLTPAQNRSSIEERGLLPRKYGFDSCWGGGGEESNANLVYLTDDLGIVHHMDGNLAVFSCEVEESLLLPDEDWLHNYSNLIREWNPRDFSEADLELGHYEWLKGHRHLWKMSLQESRCVAHDGPIYQVTFDLIISARV